MIKNEYDTNVIIKQVKNVERGYWYSSLPPKFQEDMKKYPSLYDPVWNRLKRFFKEKNGIWEDVNYKK